jgi:hypothetical protein
MRIQPRPIRPSLIIHKPPEVVAALLEIDGLKREVLLAAVEEGERARQNCTENHPVTAPGTFFYHETVRGLRDLLRPEWRAKCDGGSELTISPTGNHAIVVACGDGNVGSLTRDPRTRRKKGRQTKKAIQANWAALVQMELFEISKADREAINEEKRRNPSMMTHILLANRDGDTLIVELSLVSGLDEDGHASQWAQRIIVGSLPLGGSGRPMQLPVEEPAPDFDVVVSRRSA